MKNFNHAFIMRGIPGSGKSLTAEKLAMSAGKGHFVIRDCIKYLETDDDILAAIHSTDQYFYDDNGVYNWDARFLGRNHQRNFYAFKDSVELGIPVVICDNTNITLWSYRKYVKVATDNRYVVSIVEIPMPPIDVAAERNTHGVPKEIIENMVKKWEPWKGSI